MPIALVLFLLTYALMLALSKIRHLVALFSAAAFVLLGILPIDKILPAIDWNILMMLAGTMGIVALFIDSGMPHRLADLLLNKTPNVCWALVALSLFAGVISAFVDNVATTLIVAPVGLAIAARIGVSPVAVLISIAVSSNLQGAATLVGDTTSILLGGYAGMNFLDFFWNEGRPGIFWAVELGAVATVPVLYLLFRKYRQPLRTEKPAEVSDYFPSVLLVGVVVGLIFASFVPEGVLPAAIKTHLNGIICVALCAVGVLRGLLSGKGKDIARRTLEGVDPVTLLLLASLFVVIAGITEAGVVTAIGDLFVRISGGSVFMAYTLIVFASVLFSAFIDNIPYVMTMLPVVQNMAMAFGIPPMLFFLGLLTGATLGGNFTPIGASANITAIGMLRREGHSVSVGQFMRIGVPFSLVAVLVGYLMIWFIWS
ncbi:MAG: arsenic transporter [Oscillospiraceae bacterium]|jgi:Na+/H+ antiporter NhaD/arsenite permease-like protein|nr:arsenic transporter [Oscillospiraceae bacterium]